MTEKLYYGWLNFWMKYFGGHITIGNVTIWGANAMNWTVNVRTKRWGAVCFTLPTLSRFRRRRYDKKIVFDWYFYVSPNGTPWACTYYIGTDKKQRILSRLRRYALGHNFDSWNDEYARERLKKINDII